MDVAKQLEAARAADEATTSSADIEALWARVAPATVAAPRTFGARLRELSTARRVALALCGTVVFAMLVLVIVGGMRGGLGGGTMIVRYALAMLGLVVLAGAVFAVALRGVAQRPLGPVAWVVVGLAVAVPLALALMPTMWQTGPAVVAPVHTGCGLIGLATGLFAAVVAWLFQRSTTPVAVRVVASAAGGGVIAFAMLQLHCPADNVEHLIMGHAMVGVALVALAGLGLGVRRLLWRR